ncbi:chemotaxis protein CheA [uncultured Desulfuromonas sp.]|uniref:chemotaxis protein CheA n=1 Tax=uncultured Desulfuromonas sp. TaxID=181013 RepID=UPI00262D5E49|nr:chemotaxis protein CheA [uncultured Desulfuromonas sp.]
MSDQMFDDQMEIIREFVQESRDMIDQLEPTIIELGQSCQKVDCWEAMGCSQSDCPRLGRQLDFPCWLQVGNIGEGTATCHAAASGQECRNCRVFEMTNGDGETINAIFRLFHSMKGSAGFLDLNHIARVSHAAESLLDLVRSGKILLKPEHVDWLCQSSDFAKEALEQVEEQGNDEGMAEPAEILAKSLEEAAGQALAAAAAGPAPAAEESPPKQAALDDPASLVTPDMVERFVQEADELLQGVEQEFLKWTENPEAVDFGSLFRNIHSLKGNCGFFGYGALERLSHMMETILEVCKSGAPLSVANPAELLLANVDLLQAAVADLSRGGAGQIENLSDHLERLQALLPPAEAPAGEDRPPQLLGEILVEQGTVCAEAVQSAIALQKKPIGELLVDMGATDPQKVEKALQQQKKTPPSKGPAGANKKPAQAVKRNDIRVDLEKLDVLINLIGELVIAENMLIHNPEMEHLEVESFTRAGQQMSKIVRELQELAMSIRMIPVTGLFRRMLRLVHDLSIKSGKKVELQLSGEETELDKTVIETITDPLVHLMRNSMDHGLEPPEERLRLGKPEKGSVRLAARHEEGEVWITIEDDGRGLNRDKILEKAIAKGLVEGDGSDMSDKAIYNLIFQPGFSTADQITDISGRGVGMDVVKQNLDKIKGKIEVHSKPGLGTRLTLRIPLTLGIIDGMMVRVADTKCIVPTLAIREAFRPEADQITTTPDGEELVRVRESFFPVTRLHKVLDKTPDSDRLEDGILIVLEYQDRGIALFVDEILGQQQTVIKGLSDYIGNVRWFSGCTILGDGEVCLILDVGHFVELMGKKESAVA